MKRKLIAFAAGVGLTIAGLSGLAASPAAATVTACAVYQYEGTDSNLCDRFSGRSEVNCKEIGYKVAVKGSDPWDLDRDKNHHGCVTKGYKPKPSKPRPCPTKTPTTAPTTVPPTTTPATTQPTTPTSTATQTEAVALVKFLYGGNHTTKPTCTPPTTAPTTTPPVTPTTVPPVTSQPTDTGSSLPLTGPTAGIFAAGGLTLLVAGLAALILSRRRRTRYTA